MSIIESRDQTNWYAVHTLPQQETRADSNLRAWGIETVFPKIKDCRYNKFSGEPVYMVKPLFPRYIFARFKADQALHSVRFTRGVHAVVSFGNKPVSVDKDVIALIKSRMQEDGLVDIGEEFKAGDEVLIKKGPFKSLMGIFERTMDASNRVMVLLTTINFQGRISLGREMITKSY
jgi:transcription elongation factor/antiterminator RfaH